MTKTLKTIIKYLLLGLLLLSCLPLSALAAGNSLSVILPHEGLRAELCQVTDGSGALTPAFEGAGISVGALSSLSSDHAAQLDLYRKEKGLPVRTAAAEQGAAVFSELSAGIWLVSCAEEQDHFFNPFLLLMAGEDLTSAPKTQETRPQELSIHLIKRWEDGQNAAGKRPASVTVTLLKDGAAYGTATLTAESGWSHTFTALPADGTYTVEEAAVEGYTATYSGDSKNGLIITNTYQPSLPQTGLLRWPVITLAVAGICMIILGVLQLTGKNAHEEDC